MIRDELGVGGMAVVYRAEDTTLKREVAIKVLLPHMVRKDELAGRFLREARAAAALDHPGIMKIFDVGAADDATGAPPYIVMELLRGQSLKDFLERAGAPLGEVAAMLGAALADALHAAHQAGVIHRDVKPANVMIRADGRPVLCDFGVARLANDDAILTQSGLVLGTPVFMAPEQAMAHQADARTDVYSLGATIYQIATGALPFSGTTAAVISAVTRGDFLPPSRRNPTIGSTLGREIVKAMAKEPETRHQSAAELRDALTELARVPGLGERDEELRLYFADPAAWNQRARPRIIDAAMARATAAARRREFARALAECDRVLALDPQHVGASQLFDRVGKGARRWRYLAYTGAALCGLGVLGVGGVWLWGGPARPVVATSGIADAAPAPDAPLVVADAAVEQVLFVADAAPAAPLGPGARPGRRPAGAAAKASSPVVTAAPGPAPDAAPVPAVATPPVVEPARPAVGYVLVKIGPYCDISVDGVAHGQSPRAPRIELAPGKHTMVCAQSATGRKITREFFLDPGEQLEIKDTLIPQVEVTLELHAPAVRIDGVRHESRGRILLPTGRHRVELQVGESWGEPANVDVPSVPCTLRDRPELACQ